MEKEKISKKKCCLNSIDIYGTPFSLYYKKRSTYRSTLGTILSVVSILYIIDFSLYLFVQLMKKNSFSILISNNSKSSNSINLSNIPIMIGLIDSNSSFIEMVQQYYNITVFIKTVRPITNSDTYINFKRIELELCNESIYVNQYPQMKKYYDLSKYLCIKPNQNIIINGRYGDSINEYNSLNIYFLIYNDFTNENIEKQNEANKLLYNSFLSIHYLYNIIDHYNYTNPLSKKFRNENFQISPFVFKKFLYYFSNLTYISSQGMFSNSQIQYSSFLFDHLYLDFVENNNNNTKIKINELEYNKILEISLTCADYPIIYKRIYVVFTEIFSEIGGCIDFIYIICNIITKYFSKKSLIVDITDNLIYKKTINDYNQNQKLNNASKLLKQETLAKPLFDFTSQFINIEKKLKIDLNSKNKLNNIKNDNNLENNNSKSIQNNNENLINTPNRLRNTKFLKVINQRKISQYPQKLRISLIDYILPYFYLKKYKVYGLLCVYTDIMKSYLSLEEYFPTMERMSKLLKYDHDILYKTNTNNIFTYVINEYDENNNIIFSSFKNNKKSV